MSRSCLTVRVRTICTFFLIAGSLSFMHAIPASASGQALLTYSVDGNGIGHASGIGPIDQVGIAHQSIELTWNSATSSPDGCRPATYPDASGWTLQSHNPTSGIWTSLNRGDGIPCDADKLRASGDLDITAAYANGVVGRRTQTSGTINRTTSTFQRSQSGGDGFSATVVRNALYNVWHHTNYGISIDCHRKVDGASCWNEVRLLGQGQYQTNNFAQAYWNNSNKLWIWGFNNSTGTAGFICSTLSGTLCNTPWADLNVSVSDPTAMGTVTQLGTKLYGIVWETFVAGPSATLTCFDMSTSLPCVDNGTNTGVDYAPQYPNSSTYPGFNPSVGTWLASIEAYNGRVYWQAVDQLGCYNPSSQSFCGNQNFLNTTSGVNYPPVPFVANSSDASSLGVQPGEVAGACAIADGNTTCVDKSGNSLALPTSLSAMVTANPIPLYNVTGAARVALVGSKLYFNSGPSAGATSDVACYDWNTRAACSGFSGSNVGEAIYTIVPDPVIANCLWTTGDTAVIAPFDAATGNPGCELPNPEDTFIPQFLTPRVSCQSDTPVRQWQSVSFSLPQSLHNSSATLTIRDGTSSDLPNWVNIPVISDVPIDLSSLSISETGNNYQFVLKTPFGTPNATVDAITATALYTSDAPELCADITPSTTVCPSGIGVAPNQLPMLPDDVVTLINTVTIANTATSNSDSVSRPHSYNTYDCFGAWNIYAYNDMGLQSNLNLDPSSPSYDIARQQPPHIPIPQAMQVPMPNQSITIFPDNGTPTVVSTDINGIATSPLMFIYSASSPVGGNVDENYSFHYHNCSANCDVNKRLRYNNPITVAAYSSYLTVDAVSQTGAFNTTLSAIVNPNLGTIDTTPLVGWSSLPTPPAVDGALYRIQNPSNSQWVRSVNTGDGQFTINDAGRITFIGTSGFSGTTSITFRATSIHGFSDSNVATFTVQSAPTTTSTTTSTTTAAPTTTTTLAPTTTSTLASTTTVVTTTTLTPSTSTSLAPISSTTVAPMSNSTTTSSSTVPMAVTTTIPAINADNEDSIPAQISGDLHAVPGTVTFEDGSQLVILKTGATYPRMFTAYKGWVTGTLKATYQIKGKPVSFSCKFEKFGDPKANPKMPRTANGLWFKKYFLAPKKYCILPKDAMASARTYALTITANFTFNRLWPTTAKPKNPESGATIHPVKRTMLVKLTQPTR